MPSWFDALAWNSFLVHDRIDLAALSLDSRLESPDKLSPRTTQPARVNSFDALHHDATLTITTKPLVAKKWADIDHDLF